MLPPERYKGKEQTWVKHLFLVNYLDRVAFNIGATFRDIVYVDCFSGPWRADDDLADTSIRIALEKLNYVSATLTEKGTTPRVRAIFVEENPSAFQRLTRALDDHRGTVTTTAFRGSFESNIPKILAEVGKSFAFYFVDPTGWSGFAMDALTPILRHKPGEVLINFMYDFINRFINYPDPANERSLDRFFGTANWRTIRDAEDREAASIGLYLEQLRRIGRFTYSTFTPILKPLHDRAYFHLAYVTRNPKGIIEFRSVEKKITPMQEDMRAKAQREHKEQRTHQGAFAFENPGLSPSLEDLRRQRLAEAKERLFGILKNGPMRFGLLEAQILQLPLVWRTDVNRLVMNHYKGGQLAITGLAPNQRSPSKDNVISLT